MLLPHTTYTFPKKRQVRGLPSYDRDLEANKKLWRGYIVEQWPLGEGQTPRKVNGSYRLSSQKIHGTICIPHQGFMDLRLGTPELQRKKHLKRNRGKINSLGRQVSLAHSCADNLEKHRTEDRNSTEKDYGVQT